MVASSWMLAFNLSRRCFSARLRASRPLAGSEDEAEPDPDPDPDPVEPVLPASAAAILFARFSTTFFSGVGNCLLLWLFHWQSSLYGFSPLIGALR